MFRGGQVNPYDDIVGECGARAESCGVSNESYAYSVVKATDENQTSENWEILLNLCDKVSEEGEQG
jgi:signal transducing adaptor molecule